MVTTAPLLLTLSGCAELAAVRRPVVTMWRRRLGDGDAPFPAPVTEQRGQELFDADEVANWLVDTAHGNNPDARADAALHAVSGEVDPGGPEQLNRIASLIVLRTLHGERLADITPEAVPELAGDLDPEDLMIRSELTGAGVPAGLASYADTLVDAEYTAAGALDRLLNRRARSRDGARGPLAVEATALVSATALALAEDAGDGSATFTDPTGVSDDLAASIAIAARDSVDVSFVVPSGTEGSARMLRRRLALHGVPMATPADDGGGDRAVHVARFPLGPGETSSETLDAIDELALGMTDEQRAVVLAPAAILTDPLPDRAARGIRADLLRTGRVRGVVRLPRGLVASAPRQALALWVLGREHGDVPIDERYTVVADLTDTALTSAARGDIVTDLVASLGTAHIVRAHAFRFARFVTTASLLARDGSLVAAARTPDVAGSTTASRDIPAMIDELLGALGDAAPIDAASVTPVREHRRGTATIGTLLDEREMRLLPGIRLSPDDIRTAPGFGIVGAEELAGTATDRTIDRLVFAATYPRASLTLPGDVVFCTAPRPRAWVDAEGSHVVAYPARVLRPAPASGLVPEVIAADFQAQPQTRRDWRRWTVRRLAPEQARPLRDALTEISDSRADLLRRVADLERLGALLIDGVTSGTTAVSTSAVT